jgi:hypothetical protein
MNTDDLIQQLSQSTQTQPKLLGVRSLLVVVFLGIALYLLLLQSWIGLREDLLTQLARPAFSFEIALMILLLISGVFASVLSRYPDNYQYHYVRYIPYTLFALLLTLLMVQVLVPVAMPTGELRFIHHRFSCALWITVSTVFSAFILVWTIRLGATVTPRHSGALSVLAATAVGCLTLRLSEMNDSIPHLLLTHYTPSFLFALFGAFLGKYLFKW